MASIHDLETQIALTGIYGHVYALAPLCHRSIPLTRPRLSAASQSAAAPVRKSSIDEATVQELEKRLSSRPDKKELIDRNVLKDDSGISPRLIAAKERLERSQLQDKLEHALQRRPNQEELIKEGILTEGEVTKS